MDTIWFNFVVEQFIKLKTKNEKWNYKIEDIINNNGNITISLVNITEDNKKSPVRNIKTTYKEMRECIKEVINNHKGVI